MARTTTSARLESIDRRLLRVEEILPTLATKDDLKGMPTVDDPKGFVTTAILHQALAEHSAREGKIMREFVLETLQNGLDAQRHALKADMRALIEEERERWKVLADGLAAVVADLHRVEEESKARDRALLDQLANR